MKFKNINYAKVCAVISSGILLVTSIQQMRRSEVAKLAGKIGNLKFEHDDFGDNYPVLNNVYSELVSNVADASSIGVKYYNNEISYKVRSYIPSLESDSVSYTFYDDYISIVADDYSCSYNNDGSYSISCDFEKDFYPDDKDYSVIYNFSNEGILTDSIVYDGLFSIRYRYIDDDINNCASCEPYVFVKKNK